MFKASLAVYENTNVIAKVVLAGMLICAVTLVIVNILK